MVQEPQEVGVASRAAQEVGLDLVGRVAAEIGSLEERVEQVEGVGHGAELHIHLVHLVEMDQYYQTVAGMGIDLVVGADSDTGVEWEQDPVEPVDGW